MKKARQPAVETHALDASETPASLALKPSVVLPGSPIENARQTTFETHNAHASATPAKPAVKSKDGVPGSPIQTARHQSIENHRLHASETPATEALNPILGVPGSPSTARQAQDEIQLPFASAASTTTRLKSKGEVSRPSKNGRRLTSETHVQVATATPATVSLKPITSMPGSPLSTTVEAIRAHHRERRFAMGIQQALDRKLESYIRINKTEWHVGDDETTRDKANKDVAAKIKTARNGEGDRSIVKAVKMTDDARAPADAERARHEKEMELLARSLPVAPWVETVPGLGYLGLATIVAETGNLSMYANVAKVWKRLGYAPYNGKAGSTWKRPTWRDGDAALTAEEWTVNPFSGRRYSLIHVISVWLKNKQWIGAAKSEDGVGKPNGKYGEVYAARRARTAETHPDWSKQHGHMDGLRVMMKDVLKDLWIEWNQVERKADGRQCANETQSSIAIAATPASLGVKPNDPEPGSPIETARRLSVETQGKHASKTPANTAVKPRMELPGSSIEENGRHKLLEALPQDATAGSGRTSLETQIADAGAT